MKPARMSLPTCGWEEKGLSFQNAIFFCNMVHAVISKRMDKRSHAWPRGKLIQYPYFFIHLLFAAAHCFRSLPGQLTRLYNKHTNKTSKGERAGSASRLDSSLFEEG